MAEDFYIDEFSLTPPEEPKKNLPVLEIPEAKKQSKFENVLFGPDIPTRTTLTATAPKALYKSIKSKFTGEEYKPEDVDWMQSFAAGVIDGTIKIPYGIVNITAEIADALRKDGVPVNESYVAQLEKYFSNSVLGKIQAGAEDVVKESAIGRLTSGLIQLYSYGRAGAAIVEKAAEKGLQIYNKFSKAAKVNKVLKARPDAVSAGLRAKELNQLNGYGKFAAITIGGAAGASLIADLEDVGTWGDWLGGPSALDREQREEATDDAMRKLFNRFRFGAESAVVSVPIAYGTNLIAKQIAKYGKELKYSDDALDQWINKWILEPFTPSGNKSQFMFEGMKRVEGEIAGGQVTARDMIIDIDKTLANISKQSGISTSNPAWKRIVGRLDELLTSSNDVIEGGKIIFRGFDPVKLRQFQEFIKEVGLTAEQADILVGEMFKVRNQFNVFKNIFLDESKGNLNVANKEFMNIMRERMQNIFSSEYKIFTDKSLWGKNYKPTESAINEVKEVFRRYGAQNNIVLTEENLDGIIKDILKNVKYQPLTKTPEFPLTSLSVLDDNAVQMINIADNIKGLKFKPSSLIQSEKDLRSFQRFFGQKRDLRNTIINTMADLSSIVAKNRFYNNMLNNSKELIAKGERSMIYPTRTEAITNLKNQKIITDPNGLKLKGPLGESTYTNPLHGWFTSEEFKDALQFSEKLITDDLAKNIIYQNLFLIPKGLTQISKTILGPFTHARNFITSAQFALGTGNLFKNPVTLVKNFRQAWNTIQPQLLYRNTPKDQALYKFLLEEQVVSSSATARDIAGTLDDIGRGGDVYMKFFGKFGRAAKKLYEKAGDLYVAEDDLWKIFNFLGEFDTYKNAYAKALKNGLIKEMPNDLAIMKEAANIVRNTVPNYNYVGFFAQNMRRAPTGNFISWPVEVTRTGYNIAELGLKEARNPIFRGVGYKRLLGFGTAAATAPAVVAGMLAGMYGVTKAAISSVRELITPDFSKDSTLFVIRDKDGSFKYIDASGALVYDTLVNPFQAVVANINNERVFNPNAPLTVGLGKGFIEGLKRFMRPYIEESIWLNTFNNVIVRNGVTVDGKKLWNDQDTQINKIWKAFKYATLEVAPLSAKQFERLYYASTDKPGRRGEKYELSDELAGLYGLRAIKVDPIKSLNFKITEFKKGKTDASGLFVQNTLAGGVLDPNKIISDYIYANARRYNVYNNMQRKIKAAEYLEAPEDDIRGLFKRRQEMPDYNAIMNNQFRPLKLTKKVRKEAERQTEELYQKFDTVTVPPGVPDYVIEILNNLQQQMREIPLGDDFYKYIKPNDWYLKEQSSLGGGQNLPPSPMPNPQVVQSPQPVGITQQGLTPTENALLSDEEKQIRLRQRGLV